MTTLTCCHGDVVMMLDPSFCEGRWIQSSLSLSVSLLLRNLHYRLCGSFRFDRLLRTGEGKRVRLRMTDKWPDSQGRFIHKLRHFLLMYKYVVLLSGGVLSITEEARSNDNLLYPWTSDLSALMGSLFSRCITGKKNTSAHTSSNTFTIWLSCTSPLITIGWNNSHAGWSNHKLKSASMLNLFQLQCKITSKRPVSYLKPLFGLHAPFFKRMRVLSLTDQSIEHIRV